MKLRLALSRTLGVRAPSPGAERLPGDVLVVLERIGALWQPATGFASPVAPAGRDKGVQPWLASLDPRPERKAGRRGASFRQTAFRQAPPCDKTELVEHILGNSYLTWIRSVDCAIHMERMEQLRFSSLNNVIKDKLSRRIIHLYVFIHIKHRIIYIDI